MVWLGIILFFLHEYTRSCNLSCLDPFISLLICPRRKTIWSWAGIEPRSSCFTSNRSNHQTMPLRAMHRKVNWSVFYTCWLNRVQCWQKVVVELKSGQGYHLAWLVLSKSTQTILLLSQTFITTPRIRNMNSELLSDIRLKYWPSLGTRNGFPGTKSVY